MKTLMSTLFLSTILLTGGALAEEMPRSISVEGSAAVRVTPDRATLGMAVEARNEDLKIARDEVVRVTRAMLEFADDRGIDDDDIQTSGLSIRPDYRWNNRENRQELLGYVVRRDIVITLDDLDKLGRIMEGAVTRGVNQVQPPQFFHSREKELRREALVEATRDARMNAAGIAAALDMTLGAARSVTAQGDYRPPQPMMRAVAAAEMADAGADTYSTGQISIEARVSAQFDLVEGDQSP